MGLSPGGGLQQIPEELVNPNLGSLNYQDANNPGQSGSLDGSAAQSRHQKSAAVAWSPKLVQTSSIGELLLIIDTLH